MTTCLPKAQGVPGLSTAPNWFDSTPGSPPLRNAIDDPRWTGAFNHGYGYGTGLEAQFRGVYMAPDWRGKTSLFLSWEVLYDGSLDNGLDRLYVGFNNGGGSAIDSLLLKVVAYNSLPIPPSTNFIDVPAGSIELYNMDPATGNSIPVPPAALPTWLSHTRVWLTTTPISWTINMYVPYDPMAVGLYSNDGIKLPDPFKMFYEIYVKTPTRIDASAATGGFIPHKWPLGVASVFSGLSGDVYPHPAATAWDSFHLSTGAGDPICPTTGWVSIDSNNIGNMVDSGAPNIVVKYSTTTPQPVNTIFANVNNQTGASIPVGGITARFRIADWGSVIMDPNAPWDDIRGGAAISNAVPIPTSLWPIAAGNPPPLSFQWTLNAVEMAPYLAVPAKPSDQCLLVELHGFNITFLHDSARRNLLIQPASEVKKTAQISIEGLAAIPGDGPNRDVYVAVETVNMPAAPQKGGKGGGIRAPIYDDGKLAMLKERDISPEVLKVLVSQGLAEALATGKLLLDSIIGLVPTYRVHVYHDTGQHLTVDGINYPILEPQTSFGMLLDHVGLLTGWEHSLEFPPGALQEEITPAFFRVWIPNNGKINVTTTVRAVEPNPQDLIGCILAVFAWIRSLFGVAMP